MCNGLASFFKVTLRPQIKAVMWVCACVCKKVGGSRHEGEGLSHFFSVHSVWPQLRNRLQKQEKALDPPPNPCLLLTKHPQWPNNQWLAESPECHQISILIVSGLTSAVPVCGTLGEWFQPDTGTPHSNTQGSSGNWTEKKRINTHHNCHNIVLAFSQWTLIFIPVFNMDCPNGWKSTTDNLQLCSSILSSYYTKN